jgi:hypothetical protein
MAEALFEDIQDLIIFPALVYVAAQIVNSSPLVVTRTQAEAVRKLRMTKAAFGRLCSQLRELGQSFLSRKARPQPQRHFEKRCGTETSDSVFEISLPRAQRSVALRSNYWNRVELYNQVWNQPLVKLANKYGISDVRIGKVCRKLQAPPRTGLLGKEDSRSSRRTSAAAGVQGRACGEEIEEQIEVAKTTTLGSAPHFARLRAGALTIDCTRGI